MQLTEPNPLFCHLEKYNLAVKQHKAFLIVHGHFFFRDIYSYLWPYTIYYDQNSHTSIYNAMWYTEASLAQGNYLNGSTTDLPNLRLLGLRILGEGSKTSKFIFYWGFSFPNRASLKIIALQFLDLTCNKILENLFLDQNYP